MPTAVDEASIKDIPGAKVIWEKALLGVVAPREWDAIKASRQLKVTWSDAKSPFPDQKELYNHIRNAKPIKTGGSAKNVAPDKSRKRSRAPTRSSRRPTSGRSSRMRRWARPARSSTDQPDGLTTLWTGSQKPHFAGDGVAKILGVKEEGARHLGCRVPGSYGRNDAGDAAVFAALFSKATGKPVRVPGHAPRSHRLGSQVAGLDPHREGRSRQGRQGRRVALPLEGFRSPERVVEQSDPSDNLGAQMIGIAPKPGLTYATPEESYAFPVKQQTWAVIAPFLDTANPLRSSHLRDPLGPEIHFANESFIDEVAFATGKDPVAFRLATATEQRDKDVLKAAADKAGWKPHTAARKQMNGDIANGPRASPTPSATARDVAIVAEVQVDMKDRPGARDEVHRWRMIAASMINPRLLTQGIEGNICQGLSRAIHEEVKFPRRTTSPAWIGKPTRSSTSPSVRSRSMSC